MSVRTFMIDESFIASVIAVYFFGTGFPVDNGRTASCAKPASTDRTIYHATEKINPARRSTLNICVLYFLQIVPFRFCQVSRTVWNPAIGSFVKFTRQQCSHIRPCKIRIIIFLDETILEDVLKRLIRIIIRLGIVTGNTLDQNTDIVIDFDDSIIEDKGAERQQDRQDVSMGVMRHEEYRAKWYGETVEQAKKNLPEQNQVME